MVSTYGRTKMLPIRPVPITVFPRLKSCHHVRSVSAGGGIRAMANAPDSSITITAVLTVATDEDILGLLKFHLELVSAQLDPKTGLEKDTVKGDASRVREEEGNVIFESKLVVPATFGDVGAVLVENEHLTERFIKTIVLNGFPSGPVNITCNSWVHAKANNAQKRIFFTNKVSL